MNTKAEQLPINSFVWTKSMILSLLGFFEKFFEGVYNLLEFVITKTYKYFICFIWVFVFILLYWWFFDNTSPITYMHYSNANFYTPNDSKVNNGIEYTKSYCFTRGTDVIIDPTLSNDIIYNVPTRGPLHYNKGCHSEHIFLEVPVEFPNGVYYYKANYNIEQNPVKNIHISFDVFILTIIDAKHCIYKVQFEK